ncbi:hypothetical protein CSU92_06160 [Salmonella enterica subsp. diarizonae]|nr:hypothetical protein [Salmonella enterica subsp. diarizonae]
MPLTGQCIRATHPPWRLLVTQSTYEIGLDNKPYGWRRYGRDNITTKKMPAPGWMARADKTYPVS